MQARHKYNNVYFGKYDNIKIVKGQGWESFCMCQVKVGNFFGINSNTHNISFI